MGLTKYNNYTNLPSLRDYKQLHSNPITGWLSKTTLSEDLYEIRGRVLDSRPLPSLQETFVEVRRDESRKKLMMIENISSSVVEGSAFIHITHPRITSKEKEGHGATIVRNLVTSEKLVGNYMESLLIGGLTKYAKIGTTAQMFPTPLTTLTLARKSVCSLGSKL
ncbi:hypothetical protein J1N35_022750, partial [Gossypium stocksii]